VLNKNAAKTISLPVFLAFFVYKFRLYNYRSKVIREKALVDKVRDDKKLNQEERDVLAAMLCSLSSKK